MGVRESTNLVSWVPGSGLWYRIIQLVERLHDDAQEREVEGRDAGLDVDVLEPEVSVVTRHQVPDDVDRLVLQWTVTETKALTRDTLTKSEVGRGASGLFRQTDTETKKEWVPQLEPYQLLSLTSIVIF